MKDKQFIKTDMHIHSPASKCYKGKKDDKEYLEILGSAKAKDIRIIAITDHNTINGYKRLIGIWEGLINKKNSLKRKRVNIENRNEIKEIDKKLSLFKELVILPGVEIEVRNAIHMLVIFPEDMSLDIIDKFLSDGGYYENSFGEEDLTAVPNWDILDLFEEAAKYECLVIDAHTDSHKGILNTIPRGTLRANCFRNEQLSAVAYNNETQKDKLASTIQTSRDYSRRYPLAFVKFSDAHNANEVGREITWMRLETLSFDSIRDALKNPFELISTVQPSLARILENLLSRENSFGLESLSDDNKETLKKYICSLNNSSGGYVLLGIKPDKRKIGLEIDEKNKRKEKRRIEEEVMECFEDIDGTFWYVYTLYEWKRDRLIISVRIYPSDQLISIKEDDRIYVIKNKRICQLSAFEIQLLVEEKVTDSFGARICERLTDVEKECMIIKNTFNSLPIIRRFERSSKVSNFEADYKKGINLTRLQINKIRRDPYNGFSRGNLAFIKGIHEPRLEEAYLRYTLPMFTIKYIDQKSKPGETIYIIPGGSVYYSNRDYPVYCSEPPGFVKIYNELIKPYSAKFVTSFLKSSFMIWYCNIRYEDIDISKTMILESLRLPELNIKNPDVMSSIGEIESYFDDIIRAEKEYLLKSVKLNEETEMIDKHNRNIDKLAYKIDLIIYDLIKLSKDEIMTIEENLRLNRIYLPAKR